MVTTISKPTVYTKTTGTATPLPQGTAYKYDQLNRIVEMQAYKNINTSTNIWGYTGSYDNMYNNKFSYDANGNILTQQRRDSAGKMINALTYNRYNVGSRTLQNRLYMVDDTVASGRFGDDIDDQGTFDNTSLANVEANNNYKYDELGSLSHNTQKEIDTIKYSVYGKVKEVIRTAGSTKKNLKFDYDAGNNRIAKHVYTSAGVWEFSEYYILDALGSVMSIYKKTNSDFAQTEKNIYGSSHIATERKVISMIGATLPTDTLIRNLGNKYFQLSNHLGNILVTVSDKKIPRGNGTALYNFEPEIASATDYYPFGVPMKKRTFSDTISRYKFNGKEFDGETETVDFGERIYDGDLGSFQSIDPKFQKYSHLSPYQFAANNPLIFIDEKGEEPITAIIDAFTAFAVEAGMSYVENIVFGDMSEEEAFKNIKWGDAAVEGVKSYAVSLVFTGLGSVKALERAATSKTGKITVEFVGNLTAELVKAYNKGELSTDGVLDFDKISKVVGDKFVPSLVEALVSQGFDKKADELKEKLGKNIKEAEKQEQKLAKNLKSKTEGKGATEKTITNREAKVDAAQKKVAKSVAKTAALSTAKEATGKGAGKGAEAAIKEVKDKINN